MNLYQLLNNLLQFASHFVMSTYSIKPQKNNNKTRQHERHMLGWQQVIVGILIIISSEQILLEGMKMDFQLQCKKVSRVVHSTSPVIAFSYYLLVHSLCNSLLYSLRLSQKEMSVQQLDIQYVLGSVIGLPEGVVGRDVAGGGVVLSQLQGKKLHWQSTTTLQQHTSVDRIKGIFYNRFTKVVLNVTLITVFM